MVSSPAADTVQIRGPLPRSSQRGSSSRAARTCAITLTCQLAAQSGSPSCSQATPAFAQNRSISPSASLAVATSAATPSSPAASPGAAVAPQDRATSPAAAAFRSLTTTRAPSAANPPGRAAPLPARVTTTPAPATDCIGAPFLAASCRRSAAGRGRQVHQGGQRRPVPVRRAQGQRPALGTLEQQVRRVLPGEADPAVQLHAFLRGEHGGLAARRLGQGPGDRRVGVAGGQAGGGVPGGSPRLGDRYPHVGQAVLERPAGAHPARRPAPC